jgi:hypothetical protein
MLELVRFRYKLGWVSELVNTGLQHGLGTVCCNEMASLSAFVRLIQSQRILGLQMTSWPPS